MEQRISSGISGFDEILYGGFIPQRAYLVRGSPGAGKTILGLHFLVDGARNNEPVIFITLSETKQSISLNAAKINLDLEGVSILDLSPESGFFAKVETYDIFSPAEVEREPVTKKIIEEVERLKPTRVFIDSMTQLRYLSTDVFNYRKQVLSFLRFLKEQGATVLFTSEHSNDAPDEDLQFLSDGIIHIEATPGAERTISVTKFRGSAFKKDRHYCKITDTGMLVFPNVVPEERMIDLKREAISSGIAELDAILKGGIERGTITVITGPSGVGKTTLGAQFVKEAASRGERSAVYMFEENPNIFIQRCEAIGTPVRDIIKKGKLSIEYIEPLLYTPEEFAKRVWDDAEKNDVGIVMLDSIGGYRLALRGKDLTASLHALTKLLANRGVAVLLINETESITGEFRPTEHGFSHLTDNIIFLRYLEIKGELRKAIGVLKKRLGDFEKTLREFEITDKGIRIGPPLSQLRGILRGVPEFER